MSAITERYIQLHPRSAEIFRTAEDLFPDGVTHDSRRTEPFPMYVTHAMGAQKWDVDGHEYVDYRTGHGALLLGHSHPEIVAAVTSQMAKGTHYGASHELEVQWAGWVTKLIPSAEKVRFHSSGTEAVMMALRMARSYTGKTKVIKFQEHFHGWSDYAIAGASRGLGGVPEETLSTMIVLPPNDITAVEETLKNNNDVASIILEPTGAHMGANPITPEFLRDLRRVTQEYGIVLIFDEVVTGFRASPGGAQALYNIIPDMSTLAKVLAGGLPGGAVAGKADIINMIEFRDDPEWNSTRRVAHQGTFNANPLSAAAGCKALELVATRPINATADAMAQRLKNGLNDLMARMEIPGCYSGVASMLHLRLGKNHECDREICTLTDEEIGAGQDSKVTSQLHMALMNAGVDIKGTILLSAAHREQDIDHTVSAYEEAFTGLRREGLL